MREGIRVRVSAILSLALLFLLLPAHCLADRLTVWASRDNSFQGEEKGQWAVLMTFNQQVFRSNLSESVKATRDGVELPIKVLVRDGDHKASSRFRIIGSEVAHEPTSIKIFVKKGLSDATGRLLLEKDFTYEFLSMNPIRVTGWTTFYRSSTDKGVMVTLSRSVRDNELAEAIKITPEVPHLRVKRRRGSQYHLTGDFVYQKEYVLHISPLKMREDHNFLEAKEISFKGPGLKSAIAPRSERTVVELRGRQLFPLTVTNISKVRCQLFRVPPYLAPEFLRTGTGKASPPSKDPEKPGGRAQIAAVKALGKVRSVAPAFLGQFSEDADAFFAPDAKEHVIGYSLPLSFRKTPENGGVWVAVFSDPDGNFPGEASRGIQITDLSISYKISAKTLLLWVTSIHTGLPVKDVSIMVSDADARQVLCGKDGPERRAVP